MKCRTTVESWTRNQNGIALVITLVMLAIVTVMAIVFLAVTRRERSSVKVTEETAIAKDMADAALERVKTEVMSKMNASGSKLHYDLFNSQAFYNKGPNVALDNPIGGIGFKAGVVSPTNVAHVSFWPAIRNGSQANYLRMLANLQYDPPVPVFVETNRNGASDFRHYLDFNRNRQYETNFFGYGRDENFRTNGTPGTWIGDPEWVGLLERPDFPHSETNRFIGRMAYLVLPAGKTLDLNFMHNQLNPAEQLDAANAQNGFSRSQGVGSWEINLAAFLRELNGNPYAWYPNSYQLSLASGTFQAQGEAFNNARELLAFRFKQRQQLKSVFQTLGEDNLFNPINQSAPFGYISRNLVDDFGNRPVGILLPTVNRVFRNATQPLTESQDNQNPDLRGWPGSINANAWTDLQQLFSVENSSADFVNRLRIPGLRAADGGSANSGRSSYDRYTFYRLAAQLGTDSTPATEGKIHLNFKNPVGLITNVVERWADINNPTNASMFFTNAADLMLKASMEGRIVISNRTQELRYGRPVLPGQTQTAYRLLGDTLVREDFSLTNIQVYGTHPRFPGVVFNEYTPTVHRILQVAANIYDSMTNRPSAANAAPLPSVFMPVFEKTATNIIITRYVELGGDSDPLPARAQLETTRTWLDPESAFTNALPRPLSQYNLYGQHIIIGAKKGHPNFNELALKSQVSFSRKLAFIKDNPATTNIVATNQMFLVDLHQRWGMEAWNSYGSAYNRALTVTGEVTSFVALRDGTNLLEPAVFQTNFTIGRNLTTTNPWPARGIVTADRNFLLPLNQVMPLMVERSYNPGLPKGPARFSNNNDANFTVQLNLPPEFILHTTNRLKFWAMDSSGRLVDFVSFDRVVTQMDLREQLRQNNSVAGGTNQSSVQYWVTNRLGGAQFLTEGVQNQIDVSLGNLDESQWNGYRYAHPDKPGSISKFRQFVGAPLRTGIDTNLNNPPTRAGIRMQVPFTPTRQMIQSMTWQVNDPLVHYMVEDLRRDRDAERVNFFDGVGPAISATNEWNIGLRNEWYHPWSGSEQNTANQDRFGWNVGLMDPGVRSSDDWDFLPRHTNFTHFPNVGALGQVHRGTPWQTLYLKSAYIVDPVGKTNRFVADPSLWYDWAGSVGTYPSQDWRLLDVFTTAPNENAARGLLSVNQTNTAAWSAVLSGVITATNHTDYNTAFSARTKGTAPADSYSPRIIEPSTAQIADIVASINSARTNQFDIIRHPNPAANTNQPYIGIWRTNSLVGRRMDVFRHMGEVLHAPALTIQSPFLNKGSYQDRAVWTDRAVEFIPQQILSLLQRDEPRFVVYAFGQSLKPAPRSLTTDPNFYHMCTNYQITGEVVTKTTFRVEGEPLNSQNPLRPVVEKYEILPPVE